MTGSCPGSAAGPGRPEQPVPQPRDLRSKSLGFRAEVDGLGLGWFGFKDLGSRASELKGLGFKGLGKNPRGFEHRV